MNIDEAYRQKGQLITQIDFHQEALNRVNQVILQHIKDHALGNGDPNVMESEEVKAGKVNGKKITLRYPTNESDRPTP